MHAIVLAALSAILVFAAPNAGRAWGEEGHKIVALIAQRLLTPAARAQADALLAADPDALTAPDFVSRSTWADRWRESDRKTAAVRDSAPKAWHRVELDPAAPDIDTACFGHPSLPLGVPASQGTARACVVDKVEQFARELADHAQPQAERILALKYLINLVADLHQPSHAAAGHDQAGQDVQVLVGAATVAEPLDRFWSTTVVESLGSAPVAVAEQLATGSENDSAEWSVGSPREWALETAGVAREIADKLSPTGDHDADGVPASRLGVEDALAASNAAGEQLARAGVRLAMLLNAALR